MYLTELELPAVEWSFSALELAEKCLLRYAKERVPGVKVYPFVSTPQMEAGNLMHKQMEEYITQGKPLPPGLIGLKRYVDRVCEGAKEIYAEQSICLTNNLVSCGPFDQGVSYRGKLDLTILRDDAIIEIDYKSSSEPREGLDQLEFSALAALCRYPQYNRVHARFLYSKGHSPRKAEIHRSELPRIIAELRPRLERLKYSRDNGLWPATPGPYCRWCPVVECLYNGKRT